MDVEQVLLISNCLKRVEVFGLSRFDSIPEVLDLRERDDA